MHGHQIEVKLEMKDGDNVRITIVENPNSQRGYSSMYLTVDQARDLHVKLSKALSAATAAENAWIAE